MTLRRRASAAFVEGPADPATGPEPEIVPLGDQAVLVRLGRDISRANHRRVTAALAALEAHRPEWVVDLVPAYASLLVLYQPLWASPEQVVSWLELMLPGAGGSTPEPRRVAIPVWYDPAVGPDLEDVARLVGLPIDEVVRRHSCREVLVYMLGFKPGFPYMGEVDEALEVPRLPSPRTRVPAGSVAIAGRQTGIYAVASPGGWRIIGRTPWRLFDPLRSEPFRLRAGDLVSFCPIDQARFDELAAKEEAR
jgi:inhibitor of KinA